MTAATICAVEIADTLAFLHVGLAKAIALGLTPFLAGDAIKAAVAAVLLPGAWRLSRGAGSR